MLNECRIYVTFLFKIGMAIRQNTARCRATMRQHHKLFAAVITVFNLNSLGKLVVNC